MFLPSFHMDINIFTHCPFCKTAIFQLIWRDSICQCQFSCLAAESHLDLGLEISQPLRLEVMGHYGIYVSIQELLV